MKQKKQMEVPDSVFEALGFALPKSMPKKYQKGSSITDYVGSDRILSLKKEENTYHKVYPVMSGIGILNLKLPSIPKEDYKQAAYVLQVIGRYIKDTLMASQKDSVSKTGTENRSIAFIKDILGPYKKDLKVRHADPSSGHDAKNACAVFRLPSCYCFELDFMGGETVYGAVGMKRKRREGYYYQRGYRSQTVHIIDLVDFLSKVFLLSGVYQIHTSVKLPLVQNIFDEYLNEGMKETVNGERHMLAESIRQKSPFPLSGLFKPYTCNNRELFYLSGSQCLIPDAVGILRKVLEIYDKISYENRHRSEMSRSIATAYITKKNIPQSVQDAMKRTGFMDYFKFVEFDEEVDLKSVKSIEEEFEVLNNAYFAGMSFKDVILRFRKLGKHKASGLYYPTLHTLCVDIRCPSSFIHEYFHMIDDQLGDPSLEIDFNRITDLYKEAFLHQMEQLDNSIKSTLNGKSKYNIRYFFRRAEIFARCGEIYFSRILKVESSLIKPDLAYAYPESAALDNEVKDYYEVLLTKRLPDHSLSEAV